jgi:hypothetical protein
MPSSTAAPNRSLIAVKLLHTLVWAFMAGSIVALPIIAFAQHFEWILILSGIIIGECVVLAANRGRCPLTDWAGQYTSDRTDNFDIYLPNWLARHNKTIFGSLFVVNELIVVWRWWAHP